MFISHVLPDTLGIPTPLTLLQPQLRWATQVTRERSTSFDRLGKLTSNGHNIEVVNNGHTIQVEWLDSAFEPHVELTVPSELLLDSASRTRSKSAASLCIHHTTAWQIL